MPRVLVSPVDSEQNEVIQTGDTRRMHGSSRGKQLPKFPMQHRKTDDLTSGGLQVHKHAAFGDAPPATADKRIKR
jgi:hypothetical protein